MEWSQITRYSCNLKLLGREWYCFINNIQQESIMEVYVVVEKISTAVDWVKIERHCVVWPIGHR
jgi:hypothetical protein